MVQEFDKSDTTYQRWARSHSGGFVVNTPRSRSPAYMVLHHATCGSIRHYNRMARPGGFTERQYIKVGGDTVAELLRWARQRGASNFTARCIRCKP